MQVFGHPTWLSTLKNHVFATDLYVATVLRSPLVGFDPHLVRNALRF